MPTYAQSSTGAARADLPRPSSGDEVERPGPLHALTVGGIGAVTLGMMARVSLGHTGRTLVAPRAMVWSFAAINLAAFARAIVPMVAPNWYFPALYAAGSLWTIAFALFVVAYAPILAKPRVDGKAG